MDLLAILGLSYVFRRLRRRERDHTPAVAPPAILAPTATTPPSPAARPRNALLWRAARGLLLTGLLVLVALMPWPTAWATSAALAPTIQPWRLWVIANLDVLTVSLVVLAMIEPLLSRLLGAIWHIPHLIGLLARLVWVRVRVSYWRYRNWQRVPTWATLRSH
jgi:hypothetical protein